MIKVLPPYKPDVPATTPGMRVSVAPSPHIRFTDDVGYYDNMGRDPFQMFHVWGIKDDGERAKKAEEILGEWPGSRHRRHMLLDAARRGDTALVQCLVDTGLKIYPDIPGRNGVPPRKDGESDEEDDYGEDDNKDDPDVCPVHVAALQGHLKCVKIMIETGQMDVDVQDKLGRTPLLAASQGGNLEIVEYLLEKGANPTLRFDKDTELSKEIFEDLAGADALELAAAASTLQTELLKVLLEHPKYGIHQNREQTKEGSSLSVTLLAIRKASRSNVQALKYLLEQGGYPMEGKDGKAKGELLNDAQGKCLQDAVPDILENADYDTLMLMLSYLYPTNDQGDVLHFELPEDLRRQFTWGTYAAISTDDIKKFEWMYKFGVKEHDTMSLDEIPKGQHVHIQSLLQRCAQRGAIKGAEHLIKNYKANPDALRLPPGTRIIFEAAMYKQQEFIKYLLDKYPIDIHFGNGSMSSGPTALYMAIYMKSLDAVESLLKAGGPVDSIDKEILAIDKPISAVLITEVKPRTPIRLQTEANATEYISNWRNTWEDFNPPYVRIELTPSDKEWLLKLVPRKSDAELEEHGPRARRLNRDDTSREDPCEHLGEFPIIKELEDELEGDDDLIPAWRPMFAPVRD